MSESRQTGESVVGRQFNYFQEPGEVELSRILVSDLQRLAQHLGISGTGRMRKGELIAAIQERSGMLERTRDARRTEIRQELIDSIYEMDRGFVASSIIAIQRAAEELLGQSVKFCDLFFPDGSTQLDDRWDVLQNYAELYFPERHPAFGRQDYSRRIIDASYDPAWRSALREWAVQNKELVIDIEQTWIPIFDHLARLDLDNYVREFNNSANALEFALQAARVPFHPNLVTRSRELANLAARLWCVASIDSPKHQKMMSKSRADLEVFEEIEERRAPPISGAPKSTRPATERTHAQEEGARLEKSVVDIFELLFLLDSAEINRLQMEIRRQKSGTQFGADVVCRFRGSAVTSSSTCLVECKNYTSSITVGMVAEKLMQAEAAYEAEPLDHWILISPYQDPNNELDRLVQRWNSEQRFPFTVQIWSPQSSVSKLFAIDPAIYRELYGQDDAIPQIDV